MICIYHSRDLDGWVSAAIVRLKYPNVELIGWDYGQPLPILKDFDKLIMVDISFPPETIGSLMSDRLIWIDHHISAINAMNDAALDPNGIRDVKKAACELTWEYFFPDIKMPELVRLLGRYDCFGHKGTDEELKVLEFQYGARQLIVNTDEAYSTLLICRGNGDWSFDGDVCDEIHSQGKAIYKYLCSEARLTYLRKFEIWLDDKLFACVNAERFNPINFGINYHSDGYDGFACFWYDGKQFMYSLYNDNGDTDVSIIAKNRGGGGHKGASGFRSKEIIF